jgi:hypothetical protein
MSVTKLRNLGVTTTATSPLPSLQSSMRTGVSPTRSNETGSTPSLYNSMHLGTTPEKSKQSPSQKVIETMMAAPNRGKK